MDKEAIKTFFKLGAIVRKFTEEDMKDPQKVALCKKYDELEAEYLEWMSAVNDPKKMAVMQERMKLSEAVGLLSEALNVFMQVPVPKKAEVGDYQEAFATLVSALSEKIAESEKKSEDKKDESSEEE